MIVNESRPSSRIATAHMTMKPATRDAFDVAFITNRTCSHFDLLEPGAVLTLLRFSSLQPAGSAIIARPMQWVSSESFRLCSS